MSDRSVALGLLFAISATLALAGPGSTFQITGTYANSSGSPTTPFQGPNFTLTLTMPSDVPQSVDFQGEMPAYSWTGGVQYTDNGTTVTPAAATVLMILYPNPCFCIGDVGGVQIFLANLYVPGDNFEITLRGPKLYLPNGFSPNIQPGTYQVLPYGNGVLYSVGSNLGVGNLLFASLTISPPPGTVPSVVDLNPRFSVAGGPSFNLDVSGTWFLNGATILFNGTALQTFYTNTLGVYTQVPANLITLPGNASVTVVNPDGGVSNAAMFTIRTPVTFTTPPQLPPGAVGASYSQALSVSGGVAPYAWAVIDGAVPSGLSFSNSSGTITGIPTSAGTLSFTVAVTDYLHASHAAQTFNLTIASGVTITTIPTLPSGNVGTFYSQTLTVGGGATPYFWTLASGTLPTGLSLSSSGTVSGTPTAQGTVSFTAKVTDAKSSSATQAFSLTIGTPTGPSFIGSMPHLAAEENWTTTFTLVNKGTSTAQTMLSFFGDLADPGGNGPLDLPLSFPQQPSALAPTLNSVVNQNISPNASLIVATAGPQTAPVLVGSAQLASTGAVDGFAIFHQIVTTQEAVVPLETRNASSYLLAFDNTNGLMLGVALENISAQPAVIGVVIRDETGAVIGAGPGFIPTPISLAGNGHTAFVLSTQFPVTANIRGTIEFDTPPSGQIGVLGLRFTPPNSALTTIPVLANVGVGGGSIAHLASGGDGWQTTFVLINTGTSGAQATLSFFADQTGAPLSLPLTFPQPNGGADTVDSSVTRSLAPGATLVIVTSGAPQLLTGSAQLATAGNVSGFVIFRHNNQEAVVAMETRNANGYIIAFDNTNGTATGVALNSVSNQQVTVPIVVRDDTGAQIAADSIILSANGHYAFTLGSDKYPAAATIRGTIEFDTPAGAQIGALGIRIPPTQTYTTLPALAK